jgi:hypothetical protein
MIYLLSEFIHELLFGAGETILRANLFSSMPGQSGTAQALGSVSGIISRLIPLGMALAAQACGLRTVIWLPMAGPIALLIGLSRRVAHLTLGT